MVRGSQVRFQSTKSTLSIPSTKSHKRLPPNRYVPFLSLFLRSYALWQERPEVAAGDLNWTWQPRRQPRTWRRRRPIWGKEIHLLQPATTYTSSDGGTRPRRPQTGAAVNGRVTEQVEGNIAVDGSQGWGLGERGDAQEGGVPMRPASGDRRGREEHQSSHDWRCGENQIRSWLARHRTTPTGEWSCTPGFSATP
jgi:hypothetical protein